MLTNAGRDAMTAAVEDSGLLAELAGRRPVELVPMIGPSLDTLAEVGRVGAGLVRRPAEWLEDGTGFGATWTATDRDLLPCVVQGFGVVLEPGGPVEYLVRGDEPGVLQRAGDQIACASAFPPPLAAHIE